MKLFRSTIKQNIITSSLLIAVFILPLTLLADGNKKKCDTKAKKSGNFKVIKDEDDPEKDISELVLNCKQLSGKAKEMKQAPDGVCNVTAVDGKTFKSIVENNNGKKTVVQIWAMWCGGRYEKMLEISELIPKNNEYNMILLSTDINTKAQKQAIRNLLYTNGFRSDSYLMYNKLESDDDIGSAIGPPTVYGFLKDFEPDFTRDKLYWTLVLDENNKVIYKDPPSKGEITKEEQAKELKAKMKKLKELLGIKEQ